MYSHYAFFVVCCTIGMVAAREAPAEVPAEAAAEATKAIALPSEMPVEGGDAVSGVASLSGDMQSALAEVTKKTIDELKAMPLGKEGMNYICGYMTEAAPDGAEPESSAAWPWDNWQCKLACAGAGTGAALACTTVVACIPGVMGSIATCSQCPDILCYQPTVLAVAGTVCMTNACGSLSGGVKDACDTVCGFCNYN